MNWDDLKFFLAVCRVGSIRRAAVDLEVNHATVSRRIASFEASLGERLFHRSAKGYEATTLGEKLYQEAKQLEQTLNAMERQVAGNDSSMLGDIRVTLSDVLASYLLMEDFADFSQLYPDIHLEVIDSYRPLNLANREADVALRFCENPPDYLVGRKLAAVHRACYLPRYHQEKMLDSGWLSQQNWLGWSEKMMRPGGKIAKDYPLSKGRHKMLSATIQIQACKKGMGVCLLPCFCGDLDPELVRVPPYTTEHKIDLWILSHPDMRNNVKMQTFIRFITDRILQKKPIIEGAAFSV